MAIHTLALVEETTERRREARMLPPGQAMRAAASVLAGDGAANREEVPPSRFPPSAVAALNILALLACIGAIWLGQRFLVPVVAGMILATLVMPVSLVLGRWLHSAMAGAAASLLAVILLLGGIALAFGGQLLRVTERVPEMISVAAQQLATREPTTHTLVRRARNALQELDRAADQVIGMRQVARAAPVKPGPMPAPKAVSAPTGPSLVDGAVVALRETAVTGSALMIRFLGDMSIIFFVAFFILAGGKTLSERFLQQWGGAPSAHALQEIARQIRIYAGVLLINNLIIGGAVWLVFAITGLPDAAGWGATAAVLHVVPYFGMALLMGLGGAEAFLAFGTLGSALAMVAFLAVLATVVGTLVTAWLQSRAAKMNAAALFIGLVFWGALWGVWGLFLGPVLVVVIKVAAEHSLGGQRFARLMEG